MMKFGEAYSLAMSLNKDIVLRNSKTDVPIVKIMNYKLQLLKRLFKKLGKDVVGKDIKTKSIRMTTAISVHDLENKKRKAIEFLKTFQVLKFYMKVNIYEPENVQKGRLMLLNLAEDMKEYCKIKVAPGGDKKVEDKKKDGKEKKPSTIDELEAQAEKQAPFVKIDNADLDDEALDDDSDRASYLYMELQSTSSFKDIDIDKMLEHTTLDDFMKGLYQSGADAKDAAKKKQKTSLLGQLMSGNIDEFEEDEGKAQAPLFAQDESDATEGDLMK